jgi:hypothetical protein
MSQPRDTFPIPDTLPVVIVLAVSSVIAIAIAAWLVYQVARRAIDKTTPEGVAAVILALATLLNPLRLFLPWSTPSDPPQAQVPPSDPGQVSPHNEISSKTPREAGHDA